MEVVYQRYFAVQLKQITKGQKVEINREMFEAWLFSQPREREFNYEQGSPDDQPGCVLCNFHRETNKEPYYYGGSIYWPVQRQDLIQPLPNWVKLLLNGSKSCPNAGYVQDHYRFLFNFDPSCDVSPDQKPGQIASDLETSGTKITKQPLKASEQP